MKRKLFGILPALALALALALAAAPALAQAPGGGIPPEMQKALEAEKPLTQADIETFARILPAFNEAGRQSPEAALKVATDAGLSEPRMILMVTKVSFGLMLGDQPGVDVDAELDAQGIPKVLRPTAKDLALVKKNRAILEKAYQGPNVGGAATAP